MKIEDKTVLITGASSGIGETFAKAAAKAGAKVILLARREDQLIRVANEIKTSSGVAHYYRVDLADHQQLIEILKKIQSDHGTPDIIVNNAGAGSWKSLSETDIDEIDSMLQVPLIAAIKITKFFLDDLSKKDAAAVINITSPAAEMNIPGSCLYSIARAGMRTFTEHMQIDMRHSNICFSLIEAGKTNTDYFSKNSGTSDRIPLRKLIRTIEPKDVASAIVNTIENGKKLVIIPTSMNLLVRFHRLFPVINQFFLTHFFGWQPPR